MSPEIVAESIYKDIFDFKKKGLIDLIDEFADNTTRTFRYFEGHVTPPSFRLTRHHQKRRDLPPIVGYISPSPNGSYIHVVAEMSGRDKIILAMSMPVAICWAAYYHIFLLMVFAVAPYITMRYDFSKKSKEDKQELMEILQAEEVSQPL